MIINKEIRSQIGVPAKRIYEKVGISRSYYYAIESGKVKPAEEIERKIEEFLKSSSEPFALESEVKYFTPPKEEKVELTDEEKLVSLRQEINEYSFLLENKSKQIEEITKRLDEKKRRERNFIPIIGEQFYALEKDASGREFAVKLEAVSQNLIDVHIQNNNCFGSEERAKEHSSRKKINGFLRKLSNGFCFVPGEENFRLALDVQAVEIVVVRSMQYFDVNSIYFSSREAAEKALEKAIDKFGESAVLKCFSDYLL